MIHAKIITAWLQIKGIMTKIDLNELADKEPDFLVIDIETIAGIMLSIEQAELIKGWRQDHREKILRQN